MSEHIPFPNEVQHPGELLDHWKRVRAEVLALLDSLSDEELHRKPIDGSWTAAQIAEHLFLTQNFYARALPAVLRNKFGEDTTGSRLDHSRVYEKARRPQGVKNPELVSPEGTWDRARLVESLAGAMARLEKGLQGVTVEKLRSRGYDHPLEGVVDLLEYMWVLTLHENSHLIAMKAKWGSQQPADVK